MKHGQIAHLDQDSSNSNQDNLVFMCLPHHSEYDSKTSQHKNYTITEVKAARTYLCEAVKNNQHHINTNFPEPIRQEAQQLYPETSKLLQEVLDLKIPLVTLLRKAKQIAIKVEDKKFESWITFELEGYSDVLSENLPHYRKAYGELKSYNPYRNWECVRFQNSTHQELFSFAPIGQSIGSLEQSLSNERKNGFFKFGYTPEQKYKLLSLIPDSQDVQLSLPFETLDRILDAVRNQLYEWLLKLQR